MHINSSYSITEISQIVGGKYEGNVNFKVASICFDSRLIFNETNGLFVAIKTTKNDGHKFIKEAYEKGIFGAPTFVSNNKIFWGQDRIEFAIKEASR